MPTTSQDWQNISNEFSSKWNFPNCVGAIDGKHIIIQSPMNSGSEFINYKGTFSVVLMALVDADYCFTFADVRCQGRISDGGVFRNTTFFKKMENHQLELPSDHPLPGKELPTPHVFLADDAFALSRHILKPYKGVYDKGSSERIFNYRLSRARRIVENVFGIMASVFRILRKPMLLQPEKVSVIVMTCVLLHNFLRKSKTSSSKYASRESFDNEDEGRLIHGSWRQDNNMTSMLPIRKIPRRSSIEAQDIRKTFMEYFMTNGKVPWQENYC